MYRLIGKHNLKRKGIFCLSTKSSLSYEEQGAVEMAQWVRELAVLPKHAGLVLSTHTLTTVQFHSRGHLDLCCLLQALHEQGAQEYMLIRHSWTKNIEPHDQWNFCVVNRGEQTIENIHAIILNSQQLFKVSQSL